MKIKCPHCDNGIVPHMTWMGKPPVAPGGSVCPTCNGVGEVMVTPLVDKPVEKKTRDNIYWTYTNERGTYSKEVSDCMHDNCASCNGTFNRLDGLGPCVHMMSCRCKKCSPVCSV